MDATVANMLELVALEDALRRDCRCEGKHPGFVCSGEVTHLLTTCYADRKPRKVCQNTADYTYRWLRVPGLCADCLRAKVGCWTIRPI